MPLRIRLVSHRRLPIRQRTVQAVEQVGRSQKKPPLIFRQLLCQSGKLNRLGRILVARTRSLPRQEPSGRNSEGLRVSLGAPRNSSDPVLMLREAVAAPTVSIGRLLGRVVAAARRAARSLSAGVIGT
jgi:hypothetical protein